MALTLFLLAFWAAASLVVGYPAARIALPREGRRSVIVCFGILEGQAIQTLVLLLAWGAVPLAQAFLAATGISLVAGCGLLWHSRAPDVEAMRSWGATRADTTLVAGMVGLYGFLGFRIFTAAYSGWSAEALYWHSGLVSWLRNGVYPPTSPLEPDDLLRYRFGLHSIAAAVSSLGGTPPPESLAAVVGLLLPTMVFALVGSSIRVAGNPRVGMLAAFLGLFGGSLYPIYKSLEMLVGSPESTWEPNNLIGGLLLTGNTLDLIHMNPSIAIGFVSFTGSAWLAWEAVSQAQPKLPLQVAALLSLAYLGLMSEVHFAVLASASVLLSVVRFALGIRHDRWPAVHQLLAALLVVLAAYLLVTLRGGLLGGISITDSSPESLKLVLNLAHPGQVPAPPAAPGPEWHPLLSLGTLLDTDGMLVGLPLLLVVAFVSNTWFAALGLLSGTLSLVLWMSIYPQDAPFDAYRFGQNALVTFLTFAPFAVASLRVRSAAAPRRSVWLLSAAAVASVTAVHVAFAAWLSLFPVIGVWTAPSNPDVAAASYLSNTEGTSRVLIPFKYDGDFWRKLYGHDQVAEALRVFLGTSRHAVPMGHQAAYWNPARYRELYIQASNSFDAISLSQLKIDWIYVVPDALDNSQKASLDAASSSGLIAFDRKFIDPALGSERWLYRMIGR